MSKVVCTLDIESTGLDFQNDDITEFAYVIKEWGERCPEKIRHVYLHTNNEVTEEITKLTGITKDLLDRNGVEPSVALLTFLEDLKVHDVDYLLAHNSNGFDKPMLSSCIKRYLGEEQMKNFEYPWLDSQHDVDWPEDYRSNSLEYLCMKMDFCHNDAHNALVDVFATNKMLQRACSRDILTLDLMIEESQHEWVYVESNAQYHQKEAAKKLRYRWENIDDVHVPKRWINKFKENKLSKAKEDALAAGFSIRRI